MAFVIWILFVPLSLMALPVSAEGSAPGSREHDWARSAVRTGEILPLSRILNRLEREFVGQVVEIELEREEDVIVYEIELLSPNGHVIELYYDARTGVLVGVEGRDIDSARRQTPPMSVIRP